MPLASEKSTFGTITVNFDDKVPNTSTQRFQGSHFHFILIVLIHNLSHDLVSDQNLQKNK